MTATRLTLDFLAKRNLQPGEFGEAMWGEAPELAQDPELAHLRESHGAQVKAALERAADGIQPELRDLLRYSLVERLSIDQIALIVDVHRSTVARRITKARAALIAGTRTELGKQLGLDSMQLTSLMRLVDTRLNLSLSRVLAAQTPP